MDMELIECLKEIGEFLIIQTLTAYESQPNNNKIEQIVLDNLTYECMTIGNFFNRKELNCLTPMNS